MNKFTKDNKGVTITSLTIYVVVATIVIGILTFLNIQFFSNISELIDESNVSSRDLDFKSSFIKDLKGNVDVTEFSNNKLSLSNGITYEVRKLDSKNSDKDKYAIYRNDVKLTAGDIELASNSNVPAKFFSYNIEKNVVSTSWEYVNGKTRGSENGIYTVGNIGKGSGFDPNSSSAINTIEVLYHSNDEQNLIKKQFIPIGSTTGIVLSGMFSKSGYILRGYSTTTNGDIEYAEGDEFDTSISDLYAFWQKASGYATVTFHSGSGSFDSTASSTTSNVVRYSLSLVNGDISITEDTGRYVRPTYRPKFFKGWSKKPDGSGPLYYSEDSIKNIIFNGLSLYAVYSDSNAYYAAGSTFNSKIKRIAGDTGATDETVDSRIKYIKWSETEPTAANKTSDNVVSSPLSENQIYAWFENDTLYMWSEAENILLSPNSYGMFKNLSELKSLDLAYDLRLMSTYETEDTSQMFYGCKALASLDIEAIDSSNVTNMSDMFNSCEKLGKLNVSLLDTSSATNMSGLFSGMKLVSSLDVSRFNTASATNMSNMFSTCNALANIDVSGFDVRNVTNFSWMFSGCATTSLNVSSWRTDSAVNLEGCFANMANLEDIDVSDFDTSDCTNMRCLFMGCTSLEEVDISDFDTRKVVLNSVGGVPETLAMFSGCTKLKEVKFGEYCTFEKATSLASLFSNCEKLTTITGLDYLDTTKVLSYYGMFNNCKALEEIDVSKFKTSNATNFESFFYGCESLKELDLSAFATSHVTTMRSMFYDCKELTTIYATTLFNASSSCNVDTIFDGCVKLVGGMGTEYVWMSDFRSYIRIDGGNAKPGYFTYINVGDFAAFVDGTYFDTLQLAINSVHNDGEEHTITILKNLTENVEIQSGKIIALDGMDNILSNNGFGNVIKNYGTLSIIGGTITSTVAQGTINNYGLLKVLGGYVKMEGDRQCIYNDGGTVIIDEDANLYSTSTQRAAVQNHAGTLEVKGGIIESIGSYGLQLDAGTTTRIGNNMDSELSRENPEIRGIGYGINALADFNFYDGVVKGTNRPFNSNGRCIHSDSYRLRTTTEELHDMTYHCTYLADSSNLALVFSHSGDYEFNGSNFLITPVKLFDSDNYQKDFRITFTIKSFTASANANNQATIVNAKNESDSRWPGFCVRLRKDSSGRNMEISCKDGTELYYSSMGQIGENMVIVIERVDYVVSLTQNGVLKYRYDYSNFTNFFDVPVTFGSSYKNGEPWRHFTGVLSNISIELEQ